MVIRLKILIVSIALFSIYHQCFSQLNGNIDQKKKVSMMDDAEFSFDDFLYGYVILPSNQHMPGMVRFNGNTAIFKDTTTQKTKRFSPKELNGFVAWQDTFKVQVDTSILPAFKTQPARPVVTFHFVKQLIYGNKICLYQYYYETHSAGAPMGMGAGVTVTMGINFSGSHNIFYLKRAGEQKYMEVPSGKKAFKKFVSDYLKDNIQLVRTVADESLTYKNLEDMVNTYNSNL